MAAYHRLRCILDDTLGLATETKYCDICRVKLPEVSNDPGPLREASPVNPAENLTDSTAQVSDPVRISSDRQQQARVSRPGRNSTLEPIPRSSKAQNQAHITFSRLLFSVESELQSLRHLEVEPGWNIPSSRHLQNRYVEDLKTIEQSEQPSLQQRFLGALACLYITEEFKQ